MKPLPRKLLLSVALLPLWVLLGEGAARVVLAVRGTPYDSRVMEGLLVDLRSSVVDRIPGMDDRDRADAEGARVQLHPHPFAGWEMLGPQQDRELNAFRTGRYDESFEVLVIGGSVSSLTARFGAPVLKQALASDPRLAGREIVVLNHGRGSYKQPQMTQKAAYLLNRGYRPDAIVLIDGFNEVALGHDNASLGVHPLYPHWQKYGPMMESVGADADRVRLAAAVVHARDRVAEESDRALRYGLHHSAILGSWAHRRIRGWRRAWLDGQDALVLPPSDDELDPYRRGGSFVNDTESVLDLVARSWAESSIQLSALCDLYGITYLHVLQPTLHDEGSKVPTASELGTGTAKDTWIEGARLGYPKLRTAAGLLREREVPFLDASDTFAELTETVYYDVCHFRGAGMKRFAARVAEALLEQLPEDSPR